MKFRNWMINSRSKLPICNAESFEWTRLSKEELEFCNYWVPENVNMFQLEESTCVKETRGM